MSNFSVQWRKVEIGGESGVRLFVRQEGQSRYRATRFFECGGKLWDCTSWPMSKAKPTDDEQAAIEWANLPDDAIVIKPHIAGTPPDTSLHLGDDRRAWLQAQGGIQPTIVKLIDDAMKKS